MTRKKATSFPSISLSEQAYLPTGIFSIDVNFKGWPVGRLSLVTGFPGSGKTTLALSTANEAIKRGIQIHYFDSEMGLSQEWSQKLGIQLEKIQVYQDLTLERSFEIMEELIKDRSLIIIDSIAALLPEGDESYGYRARFLSQNLPYLLREAWRSQSTLIALNQLRYSFSSPGNYILPGGFALMHYASLHMELSVLRRHHSDKGVEAVEVVYHLAKVKQGNYNVLPKGSFIIHFKEGINPSRDLRRLAEVLKIIKVENNMVYLDNQSWTERGFLEWIKREGRGIIINKIKEKISYGENSSQEDSKED